MTDPEKRCEHLTEEDRKEIQAGPNAGMPIQADCPTNPEGLDDIIIKNISRNSPREAKRG